MLTRSRSARMRDAFAGGAHDGAAILRDGFFDRALHEFAAQGFFDHVVKQAAGLVEVALNAGVEGADVFDTPFDEVIDDEPFFFVGHEAFGFDVQALDTRVKEFDVLHEGDFEFETGFVVGADEARELGDDGDLPFVDDVGAADEQDEGDGDSSDEGVEFVVHAISLAAAAAFVAAAVRRGGGSRGFAGRAVAVCRGGRGSGAVFLCSELWRGDGGRCAAEVDDGAAVVGIYQHFVALRVDVRHGVKVEALAHDGGIFAVGGEQVIEAAAVGGSAGKGFGFVGLRGLNEAFGLAACNGDAFAGVGFGFETEAFFVFTGADGIFESILHFNRRTRVLQFEGDDFKAEVVLDEGFFDDLFGFLWPLAAFVDEDVINGIAANDFADGRDDDIA